LAAGRGVLSRCLSRKYAKCRPNPNTSAKNGKFDILHLPSYIISQSPLSIAKSRPSAHTQIFYLAFTPFFVKLSLTQFFCCPYRAKNNGARGNLWRGANEFSSSIQAAQSA